MCPSRHASMPCCARVALVASCFAVLTEIQMCAYAHVRGGGGWRATSLSTLMFAHRALVSPLQSPPSQCRLIMERCARRSASCSEHAM